MKNIFRFILIIQLFFVATLKAQITETWERDYVPSTTIIRGSLVLKNNKDQIVVCGNLASGTSSDVLILKYDTAGTSLSVSLFGTISNRNVPKCLLANSDNDLFIAGFSEITTPPYASTLFFARYDTSGFQKWVRSFNAAGYSNAAATDMAFDDSGNMFVTGNISNGTNDRDFVTIKYDTNGIVKWYRIYSSPLGFEDVSFKIKTDHFGNSYVGAQTNVTPTSGDMLLIKYDSSGTLLWDRKYNDSLIYNDAFSDMMIDSGGNIFELGTVWSSSADTTSLLVVKYDSSGTQLKESRYNDPIRVRSLGETIKLYNDSLMFISGLMDMGHVESLQSYFACVDTGLNIKWSKIIDGPDVSLDYPFGIEFDKSGHVYFGSMFHTVYPLDFWGYYFLKCDIDSNVLWTYSDFDTLIFKNPAAMIVTAEDEIYVTGEKTISSTDHDCFTVKYSNPLTGLRKVDGFTENYITPNPASAYFKYALNEFNSTEVVKCELLNINGELLYSKRFNGGKDMFFVYGAKYLQNGTYFLRISTENKIINKKVVIIK